MVKNPKEFARYLSQIEAYNQHVKQLRASLDIRAAGVASSFVHEQADIIAQEPHFLYWSLRSFFGTPSMLIASNGDYITMYDFTGQSGDPYQEIPLSENSFFELMDFPFYPKIFVNFLMAKVPLDGSTELELELEKASGRLQVKGQLKNGWEMISIFDLTMKRLLEAKLVNNETGISYQIKYSNFEETNGVYFPRSFLLLAKAKSRFVRFHVKLEDIELNGDLLVPDVFHIGPQ